MPAAMRPGPVRARTFKSAHASGRLRARAGVSSRRHPATSPAARASKNATRVSSGVGWPARPAKNRTVPPVTSATASTSVDDAGAILAVHPRTVRRYVRTGKLPAYRLAGERVVRIRRADLMALLEPVHPEEAELPG